MENLINRIDVKHVNNKKYYLKWTSKPSYMSHKIFDNDLVAILKNKITLTLNKPAYIGMCIVIYFFSNFFFLDTKKYMICLISFSKFSDVLPAYTCARAIVNL